MPELTKKEELTQCAKLLAWTLEFDNESRTSLLDRVSRIKELIEPTEKPSREERSRNVIKDLGNLVNGGADMPAILDQYDREHRTLQQSMFGVLMGIIVHVASDDYRTDGRNEYSKQMAKELIAGFGDQFEKKEVNIYLKIGYSEDEAKLKAAINRKYFDKDPSRYMNLPLV